jgi:O-Antigen ligase/Tetratricopeptide repeat
VSSLAGSPDATGARLARPAPRTLRFATAQRGRAAAGLAGAIALLIVATAFVGDGGLRLERTTFVEIAFMLLGAALCAAALLVPQARAERMHGGLTLTAVALLAAYTAISITWSLAPSDSWIEANRTFSYLAAFAGTMALARLAPGRWPAMLHGISIACVVVCGWALLTKVFPGALAEEEIYARLRAPFDYWNAVGLMAALGIVPLLWLGARRTGRGAVNALAWPGIALLEVALMLAYSRGALLALAAGLVFWFAVVPLRLRSAVVLLGATAGAAPVVGWAFTMTGLNTDRLPLDVRSDTGHELGALLLVMVAALLALGLVAGFLAAERPATPQAKKMAGRALLGVLAAVPVIALIALASAPGGVDGQVSKAWDQLTNPNASTPDNTPGRLTETSSVRARYWDEAFGVHGVSPWVGTGAGAYATVRMRYRTGTLFVRHAHGYVPQTLADLGWAGLGLSLLALFLWGWSAIRTLGMRPRDRGLPWDSERVGMAALGAVALMFGVHSAVDWTWFVPATALCGLLAAAWVIARPSLRSRMEAAALAAAVPAAVRGRPRDAAPLWAPPRADAPPVADVAGPGALPVADAGWQRRSAWSWPALGGAVLVLTLALTAAWAAIQPVRAVNAGDAAIERLQEGGLEAAVSIAMIAHDRNPLSPEPLWELAYIEQQRGRLANAEDALEEAVRIQPASAEAWRRLGRFQLSTLNQPSDALASFRAAYFLDPRNPASTSDFLEASRATGQPAALPPASP